MSPFPHSDSRFARDRGAALIFVLATLSIVALCLVSFVTVTRTDRSATQNYSQSLKAEQMGVGCLQLVANELQKEMAKDQLPDLTYPTNALYTNVTAANLLPTPIGVNQTLMTNLVKISTNAPSYTGSRAKGTLLASTLSSTAASQNGHYVSLSRWNMPYLGTFPNNASAPYWVMMTRDGPTNAVGLPFGATGNTANNPAPSNKNYILSRFAYAVYDVGGLLNINVAGYPASEAASAQMKGSAAWADLSLIPGVGSVDNLVKWRNAASRNDYSTYVTKGVATNGFQTTYPGDTQFLSRSDLIRYARDNPSILSTNALPYLTVFSKDSNVPSWGPTANLTGYAYKDNANTAAAINRALPRVRVATGKEFTRRDGTTAHAGEPLLNRRFPLSRLALVSYNGTGGTGSDVFKYFGLQRADSSSPWVYCNIDGTPATTIKTLQQAADEKREPNFFELLQACILSGSVGQFPPNNSYISTKLIDQITTYQIMRIGANIIDQADADNYPTILKFNGIKFEGIEDIPYPNKVLMKIITSSPYQNPSAAGNVNWFSTLNPRVFFEMWNPHQQLATTPAVGPTEFRIVPYLGSAFQMQPGSGPTAPPPVVKTTFPLGQYVKFNALYNSYREPTVVFQDAATSNGDATILDFPTNLTTPALGYMLNGTTIPASNLALLAANHNASWFVGIGYVNALFSFQYKDANQNWQTYATSGGLEESGSSATGGFGNTGYWLQLMQTALLNSPPTANLPMFRADTLDGWYMSKADPRTTRMGVNVGANPAATTTPGVFPPPLPTQFPAPVAGGNNLIVKDTASGIIKYLGGGDSGHSPWPMSAGATYRWDMMSQNVAGQVAGAGYNYTAYADADAAIRPGDSYLSPSNQPMLTYLNGAAGGATNTRPIILNRPFRSVGELGYAFRDVPWKTLDFFSASSADAALMDAFSVEDTTVTSGRVNLNTRNATVLKALLNGTRTLEATASVATPSTLTSTDADRISKALVALTSTTPMLDSSELAPRLAGVTATLPTTSKLEHEAVARALASSTSARTWNLLIDVVEQTGKYPPTATALKDFVVEGERRYWMHLAIDRYTGAILSKSIETPSE
ncbi:hypothetical protein SAMN05444156_1694 [Verrucomicrobium sp. GAS474]|uniref:hypothetical protein n=1 Tax=Verrucomicrobium sp. GAS474 TaxID=1882831 RepID=UPI00087B0A4B|nr:hypothetical protein [Verrucomicrobium sp. GAS474]SDU05455.1 hypothetical protein SAMN05444156_1694 [Verrucomicrobium sp. GAS474]